MKDVHKFIELEIFFKKSYIWNLNRQIINFDSHKSILDLPTQQNPFVIAVQKLNCSFVNNHCERQFIVIFHNPFSLAAVLCPMECFATSFSLPSLFA